MLTEQQQAFRATGIGASECAIAAGVSRYSSRLDLYLRKRGLAQPPQGDALLMGTLLEPVVLELYRRSHPTWQVIAPNVSLRSPSHPLAIATPDGFVTESGDPPVVEVHPETGQRVAVRADRLVQVKTTGSLGHGQWGEEGTDEIPLDYLAQVQWEMAVAGVPVCDLALLVAGRTFKLYTVAFDADLFRDLYLVNEAFWYEHVAPGRPPEVDGSEAGRLLLAQRFPRENKGEELTATDEIDKLGHAILALKKAERDNATQRALLEQRLQEVMGTAESMQGRGWRATWKLRAGSTQWKGVAGAVIALADDARRLLSEGFTDDAVEVLKRAPALVSAYKSEPSRVFRAAADNEEEQ